MKKIAKSQSLRSNETSKKKHTKESNQRQLPKRILTQEWMMSGRRRPFLYNSPTNVISSPMLSIQKSVEIERDK
jgi:hypothetical protein